MQKSICRWWRNLQVRMAQITIDIDWRDGIISSTFLPEDRRPTLRKIRRIKPGDTQKQGIQKATQPVKH